MKNCCVPIPTEQKKLLKVVTCLYEIYVLNQTPSTDAYFANPTSSNYDSMKTELTAINTLINNYLETNKTFVDISGNNIATVDLWATNALGVVAYNNDSGATNTYANAISASITLNGVLRQVGGLKPVQKLNNDECASKAYQVTPVTRLVDDVYSNYTQATLVERIGCPGVSNLGFLGLYIQIPLELAPFNTCYTPKC